MRVLISHRTVIVTKRRNSALCINDKSQIQAFGFGNQNEVTF